MVGIRLAFESFGVLPLAGFRLGVSGHFQGETKNGAMSDSNSGKAGHGVEGSGGDVWVRLTWTSFKLLSSLSPQWIISSRLSYPVSRLFEQSKLSGPE